VARASPLEGSNRQWDEQNNKRGGWLADSVSISARISLGGVEDKRPPAPARINVGEPSADLDQRLALQARRHHLPLAGLLAV
jgi:hypothetical protein